MQNSKALFLKRLSRKEEAVEAAIISIRGYCWNWSAWLLLASCLGDRDEVCKSSSSAYRLIEIGT